MRVTYIFIFPDGAVQTFAGFDPSTGPMAWFYKPADCFVAVVFP